MNTALITAWIVMRKELTDFVRDRRTFLLTLLMGPLLYPLLLLGMGKLAETRAQTQLDKPLRIPVAGIEHAPNLIAFLAGQGISATPATPAQMEDAIRDQREDVGVIIDADYPRQWRAGEAATVEVVVDSTRRDAEVPAARVRAALQAYARTVGALRLLARGIDPQIARPLDAGTRDLATPEAKRSLLLTAILPILLLISAFLGGAHLSMDTTAGERERQSLEPLLATPAARGAIVSGKMLAACAIGVLSLLLILLSFKLSATFAGGMARSLDVRLAAIGRLLAILLPLVLMGTALITLVAAGAKSMKEAQSHYMWMMMLPMIPSYALIAYPVKDTALWQYAVPFLSQNQMVQKVARGEAPSLAQWLVCIGCALALALALWLVAVWRYRQEKLAISS